MKKNFVVLMMLFLCMSAAVYADEFDAGEITVEITEEITEEFVSFPSQLYSGGVMMFSNEISPQQKLYALLEEGLTSRAEKIDITSCLVQSKNGAVNPNALISYSEFMDIFCSVVYNHPECGYLRTAWSATVYGNGAVIPGSDNDPLDVSGIFELVAPKYLSFYDEQKYCDAVDYALSKTISPGMTDIEKLLAIHDYIVDNTKYDLKYNTSAEGVTYTPYGVLINRLAVCQGYALAFKYMCDRAGLDCGYAINSNHMWNVVYLDGEYYHIDATWDDPSTTSVNGTPYEIDNFRHTYFLLSDEQIAADHAAWTTDRPECTDSTLHDTLPYKGVRAPIIYKNGTLWYRDRGLYADAENGYVFKLNGKLYRLDGNSFVSVSKADFLPDRRLECVIYDAFDGRAAIEGTPGEKADLYIAQYLSDGTLAGVEKADISFDENGAALADVGEYSKLMLFSDNGLTPLAYTAE